MAFAEPKVGESSHSRPLSVASTAIGEQHLGIADDRGHKEEKGALAESNAQQHGTVSNGGHGQHAVGTVWATMTSVTRHLPFVRLRLRDHIKTFVLLSLHLVTLPLSFTIALLLSKLPASWVTYFVPFSVHAPFSADAYRRNRRAQPGFRQRTVLVTGINMTKGLTLARAFYLSGHRVVGADFDVLRSSFWVPDARGRFARQFSLALDKAVYNLDRPVYSNDMGPIARRRVADKYADAILEIMHDEGVDLWVSCSGVATALEDGLVASIMSRHQRNGPRKVVQLDEETTKKLHEKSSFVRYMHELKLPVPETHEVVSRDQANKILLDSLRANNGRKFILKPVGMDDAHRGNMTLLPLPMDPNTAQSPGQATEVYVNRLPISKERPWILQQFIPGNEEYCTHALVVDGEVKVFVACPSSEMLMHYKALPADDALRRGMLSFTKAVARAEKSHNRVFTGHLSFDFMVERDPASGKAQLYAIECNPRAHTAVALFATPGDEMQAMVEAYMSVFQAREPERSHPEYKKWHLEQLRPPVVVGPPAGVTPRYWLGHDLVALLLLPVWKLLTWQSSVSGFTTSVKKCAEHVEVWKDGVFELWDPWPFVALYHVFWPTEIAQAWWRGQGWSRVNVSTTKMFAR